MAGVAVPTRRISQRARRARPGHALLTVICTLLFGLGWVAAKLTGLLWLGLAWSVIAVAEGWREGRKSQVRPRRLSAMVTEPGALS